MKKKQYIIPLSLVCACNTESAMLTGSKTGTIQVGGSSDDEWFSKRNDNFDEFEEDGDATATVSAQSMWGE